MNNFFPLKYQIKWKFGQNHVNGSLPYGQFLRKFMNGQKSKKLFFFCPIPRTLWFRITNSILESSTLIDVKKLHCK